MEHKTENFTAEPGKFYTSNGNDFILPDATECVDCAFVIKNISGMPVYGTTVSEQTIDGETTCEILASKTRKYVSDGANWFKMV